MSYCRIGENGSDVYMFTTGAGWHISAGGESLWTDSLQEARNRLLDLREAGLHVPDEAMARVEKELENPEGAGKEYREKFRREIETALAEEKRRRTSNENPQTTGTAREEDKPRDSPLDADAEHRAPQEAAAARNQLQQASGADCPKSCAPAAPPRPSTRPGQPQGAAGHAPPGSPRERKESK